MTAIVAVVDDGRVYMGCDSASVGGLSIHTSTIEKVFETGSFLIGFTSSWRMGQLLRYAFTPPERVDGQSVEAFLVTSFMDAVRQTFKDGGFAEKEKEAESGGEFLIGFEGRIFHVHSNYLVQESVYGYDACGSGEEYALGVFHATVGEPAGSRCLKALEAAAEFSAGVRGPFLVKSR